VGFMGSGKTTVGVILARRLGRTFLDLDREIVRSAGESVRAIFAAEGEAGFRKREARALARAARLGDAVIAVGGGAVSLRANTALMRRSGTVVYLQAPWTALRRRVGRRGAAVRPLWGNAEALLAKRRPLYARAAHFRVRAALGSPTEIAERIARRLAGRKPRRAVHRRGYGRDGLAGRKPRRAVHRRGYGRDGLR